MACELIAILIGPPVTWKPGRTLTAAVRLVMLVDRRTERSALDSLIASARGGMGRALVLRGEPGIGKTALLEYAIESASGFRIARAVGVESEMEPAGGGGRGAAAAVRG
jgi:hypothetical protein